MNNLTTMVSFISETTGSTSEEFPDETIIHQFNGTDANVTVMCDKFANFLRSMGYIIGDVVVPPDSF